MSEQDRHVPTPTRAGRFSLWRPDGQPLPPAVPTTVGLSPGTILGGRYRILEAIGEGGMGRVYAAMHVDLEKRFAVKLIRPELGNVAGLEEVFRAEARAASRIGHPNIVEVSDFGRAEDGALFMVMEYLQGESLRGRLERVRAVPVSQALRILLQVAQALSAAHASGVAHRDVKPDNVLLCKRGDEEDFVKVLDFGVAHALGGPQGAICGTPQYMPPEQAGGGPHDHRVDIFAFGVLAYETLTGRLPYAIRTPVDALLLAQPDAPRPPPLREARPGLFVTPTLSELLFRCLDPLPEGRPSSMQEIEWALIGAGAAPLETLADREARRFGLTPPPQPAEPEPLALRSDTAPMRPAPMPHRTTASRPAAQPVRLELAVPVDPQTGRPLPPSRQAFGPELRRTTSPGLRALVRYATYAVAALALYEAWRRGYIARLFDEALRLLSR